MSAASRLPAALAAVALLALAACGDHVEVRVLHRSSCEVCHQPLNEDGVPEGIEEAHPWAPLSCTDCHGGNAWVCDGRVDLSGAEPRCDGTWVYDQDLAHPDPAGSPTSLRGLAPAQLDAVDPDWLRFVNPGDLRVVPRTCGRCHTAEAAAVRRSPHAHAAGELAAARTRAGQQPTPMPRFGAAAVIDSGSPGTDPCSAQAIARFDPLPIIVGSGDPRTDASLPNAQDHLLAKECVGCHIQDFGPDHAPGLHRSSGCSACHMVYAEDGLSRSGDPWVPRDDPSHPIAHRLQRSPPSATCQTCHWQGARIGLSYRGWRDPLGDGRDPARAGTVDRPLFGHPAGHYIHDEDTASGFDETPPDVHFEAGMDCVDCHGLIDSHGDGRLSAHAACAVRATCEGCHGTVREAARPTPLYPGLFRGDDGELFLRTRVEGRVLPVRQVVASLDPDHPRYDPHAALAKGVGPDGFSHADVLECTTCHSGWVPSCYGCHVEVDLARSSPNLTTGVPSPGALSRATGLGFQAHDMVLVRNHRGRFAHSMPAERLFMTLLAWDPASGASEPLYAWRPRTVAGPGGERVPGFGQRPIDPHTTRRVSPFMACDRCHTQGELEHPDNEVLLDLTHGFGTERFLALACPPETTCDPATEGEVHRLDAVIDRDGASRVMMAHPSPEARPLTLEEIARMRAIQVPADAPISTPIPPDARTNPAWPAAQDLAP